MAKRRKCVQSDDQSSRPETSHRAKDRENQTGGYKELPEDNIPSVKVPRQINASFGIMVSSTNSSKTAETVGGGGSTQPYPYRPLCRIKSKQCENCLKYYATRRSLKVHMRKHTGEKPYHCAECNLSFAQSNILRAHQVSHTGVRAFPCTYCEKTFKQSAHRRTHEQLHTNLRRKYECEVCRKLFGSKGILSRHSRQHTGEKPYKCKFCSKSYTRFESVRFHEASHDRSGATDRRPYRCTYVLCHARYTKQCSLIRHQRKVQHHCVNHATTPTTVKQVTKLATCAPPLPAAAAAVGETVTETTVDMPLLFSEEVERYLDQLFCTSSISSWTPDSSTVLLAELPNMDEKEQLLRGISPGYEITDLTLLDNGVFTFPEMNLLSLSSDHQGFSKKYFELPSLAGTPHTI